MTPTRLVPSLALALFATAAAAAGPAETFRAQGNEPFWSLRKTPEAITFQAMGGDAVTVAPVPEPAEEGGASVFRANVEDEAFVLRVASTVCTDTMSGMPFPYTVGVDLGADSYAGCGGEPAALLGGDWRIAAIDGDAPVADTAPSLSFGADGKVSGAASCNRFFGTYTLTGEGLGFGEMGASMMLCDDAVMAQERAVLDILAVTTGFAVADDGTLTLLAGDGRTITATRSPDR